MSKTAVQTPICDICGAEVREGSLFCYNCGGSLKRAAEDAVNPTPEPAPAASANGAAKRTQGETRTPRRRRASNRGPVEIVWEPKTGLPIAYIAGSVILLALALMLLIAAIWLQ